MTDRPTKMLVPTFEPYFIVGTTQEAERLRHLRYEVIDASKHDPDNVAIERMYGHPEEYPLSPAIILLEEHDAIAWGGVFDRLYIPYVVPNSEKYVCAMLDGTDDELHSILGGLWVDAEKVRDEAAEEAIERGLMAYHVHGAMSIAMELYGGVVYSEPVPTGLKPLDDAIGGGLPQGGLSVLGAGSSNGKTTLALQIADNLAAAGWPVLFVTIEQSRHELVAKSLSRLMRQTPKHNGGYYVASAAHIMSRKERASWPQDKEAALLSCSTRYSQTVAPHMHIMEMSGQPTFEDIRNAYDAIVRLTYQAPYYSYQSPYQCERQPVLIVDYLQLIKPANERMTERQAIDFNVMSLRQLARDNGAAVLAISSINRQSYSEGAGMSAFKESGAIEFSADLALMLQPRGFNGRVRGLKSDKAAKDAAQEAMEQHKGKANRQSEIVVLKNRGGAIPSGPLPLNYDAMCNIFTEGTSTEATVKKPL